MLTKQETLALVTRAASDLYDVQPGHRAYTKARFRRANSALVRAQLAAADAGASSREITRASEWNGIAS